MRPMPTPADRSASPTCACTCWCTVRATISISAGRCSLDDGTRRRTRTRSMSTTTPFSIRPIEPRDDDAVADLIRGVMPEFGADGPGFAIHDAEVDAMAATYARPGRAYFVVELDGIVCGGGGIAELVGGDPDVCELRKMYFLPRLRGRGAGHALLMRCLAEARARLPALLSGNAVGHGRGPGVVRKTRFPAPARRAR